jgi:putative membrane protein
MTVESSPSKKYNVYIVILSITIPIVVALMFSIKLDVKLPIFLPPVYATINAITGVLLIIAVWAIKNKKRTLHERLMKTAILCSVVFLMMYLAYHMTSDSTKFGGEGGIKYIYLFILLTHILLSIVVIPFVLLTYVKAITNDFEKHKKIAKITFPLWLYVAVSGVVVYVLISPYYS